MYMDLYVTSAQPSVCAVNCLRVLPRYLGPAGVVSPKDGRIFCWLPIGIAPSPPLMCHMHDAFTIYIIHRWVDARESSKSC